MAVLDSRLTVNLPNMAPDPSDYQHLHWDSPGTIIHCSDGHIVTVTPENSDHDRQHLIYLLVYKVSHRDLRVVLSLRLYVSGITIPYTMPHLNGRGESAENNPQSPLTPYVRPSDIPGAHQSSFTFGLI